MTDPKKDPARRCMRLAEWPAVDQKAWASALRSGDLLDHDAGLAAHWKPKTVFGTERHYGRWLTFLRRGGFLDRSEGPADRVTEDRLRAYIGELRSQVSPQTVSNRVTGLAEALRVMAPGATYDYLARARYRLRARARPSRNKRAKMVPAEAIVELSLSLMERAENGAATREVWGASLYRDGLTLLLLAHCPIRRDNLAAMRVGQHLNRIGDGFEIRLPGDITKNGDEFRRGLPKQFTPFIERYLQRYRPLLLGDHEDDHVWISCRNEPMSGASIYGQVRSRTKARFGGEGINPHLLRDIVVSRLADENPELVWLAPALLGHRDPHTTWKAYNQALDSDAVRKHQAVVLNARQS